MLSTSGESAHDSPSYTLDLRVFAELMMVVHRRRWTKSTVNIEELNEEYKWRMVTFFSFEFGLFNFGHRIFFGGDSLEHEKKNIIVSTAFSMCVLPAVFSGIHTLHLHCC